MDQNKVGHNCDVEEQAGMAHYIFILLPFI